MVHNISTQKTKTFPWKLHEMLELAEKEGFEEIVSWLPDAKSFKVYNPNIFVHKIMPKFFHQSKYKSFQRQLNLWGFERLTAGPGKGGYTRTDYFSRYHLDEICHIRRHKIKYMRLARKENCNKNSTKIIDIETAKNNNKNNNVIVEQTRQASGAVSIISDHNCDVSSISSGSECEQSRAHTPVPLPRRVSVNETEDECPQTGDCLDFEGRSYFFVDEEEIDTSTNYPYNITLQRKPVPCAPAEMPFRPLSFADVSLYRQLSLRDLTLPYVGSS